MVGLVLVLFSHQRHVGAHVSYARPPTAVSSSATVAIGVTTAPLAESWWRPWRARDLATVDAFERAADKRVSIVMWYADWQHTSLSLAQLREIDRRGSIPEITWEPWDAHGRYRGRQPRYTLRHIIDGSFDPYIRTWARGLAAWGKPVWIRFAQEMNGFWYPWSERGNGNHRGEFVPAWRHVHDIFTAEHATNVRWVWSPVAGAPSSYFPGLRYVDVLGLTCLNGGTRLFPQGWRSFDAVCGRSIRELHVLAPELPVELAEVATASVGGSKPAWIKGAFASLTRYPEVRALVWFDIRKETDWRIESSAAASRAFAAGVRSSRYG
jgi:mannan endo-1,4-beta-mannosidase